MSVLLMVCVRLVAAVVRFMESEGWRALNVLEAATIAAAAILKFSEQGEMKADHLQCL